MPPSAGSPAIERRRASERWAKVNASNGCVTARSGFDLFRPTAIDWDTHTSLEKRTLWATQRFNLRKSGETTVAASESHGRVFGDRKFIDFCQDVTNRLVERFNPRGIDVVEVASFSLRDRTQCRLIFVHLGDGCAGSQRAA